MVLVSAVLQLFCSYSLWHMLLPVLNILYFTSVLHQYVHSAQYGCFLYVLVGIYRCRTLANHSFRIMWGPEKGRMYIEEGVDVEVVVPLLCIVGIPFVLTSHLHCWFYCKVFIFYDIFAFFLYDISVSQNCNIY